ncbi:MAG TPA: class I SAM-dependent methyltransferase [Candidatus Avidesulfovibrio excrementigallinarum]|nr:class I SAM-dependent methyltransferase [Candidatus Avidesulfovibrio excrementigallinarum]
MKTQYFSQLREYWSGRVAAYSSVNEDELLHEQGRVWEALLRENLPAQPGLKVLDAGCGPGFFSILMARGGHDVTAVDCSASMLDATLANVGRFCPDRRVRTAAMDVQQLALPDKSFDVVLSRNVTWNLEHPEAAYAEWLRVLRPGGVLLNFDANWYAYLFDEVAAAGREQDLQAVREQGYELDEEQTDDSLRDVFEALPLGRNRRPEWDCQCLEALGYREVTFRMPLPEGIMNEYYRTLYAHTPMFLIRGIKG